MQPDLVPAIGFAYGRTRLWQAILLIHAVFAVAWWWLTPNGFPVAALRFWSNTILPLVVVTAAAIGCHALEKRNGAVAGPILAVVPFGWTAALTASWLIFPVSAGRFLLPMAGFVAALWLAFLCWLPVYRPQGAVLVTTILLAAVTGSIAPWTQRAPDADTTPLDLPISETGLQELEPSHAALIPLSEDVHVLTAEGNVIAKCGSLKVDVAPLLTFESRSPDRCWTILAPPNLRSSPRRRLMGERLDGRQASLSYEGDARHALTVSLDDDRSNEDLAVCTLESFSRLDAPVFSHLNAYSTITVRGHRKLALAFSPCPAVVVEVEPADYPVGRPARFAYLDAEGVFHVVEASSGEKGPFRQLGSAPLDRQASLGISLFDDGKLAGDIVFADWASQASVALSPTAGWGVTANAIEFLRFGNDPSDLAEIWLTLAGTSVGRGWDSVGHRAGTYRNRVRISVPRPAHQIEDPIRPQQAD